MTYSLYRFLLPVLRKVKRAAGSGQRAVRMSSFISMLDLHGSTRSLARPPRMEGVSKMQEHFSTLAGDADLPLQKALSLLKSPVCIPSEMLGTRQKKSLLARWQQAGQAVILSIAMLAGSTALAKFEFSSTPGGYIDGGTIDLENYDDSVAEITYSFTLEYRSCSGQSCGSSNQANYRLAISDQYAVYNSNRMVVTNLQDVMNFNGTAPRANPAGKSDIPLTPSGSWSHGDVKGNGFDHGNGPSAYITATFTIKLNNLAQLKDIANSNDPFLRFDVHGEVVERNGDTIYPFDKKDQKTVAIRLNYAAQYRISGLRDMAMDSKDFLNEDYYSDQMPFCVYVSEDPYYYRLRVWGTNNSSEFTLKNGRNTAPYEVQVASSIAGLDSATPHTDPIQLEFFNGHTDETCNSHTQDNAAIRVRVKKTDVPASGEYSDKVYVMVSAT